MAHRIEELYDVTIIYELDVDGTDRNVEVDADLGPPPDDPEFIDWATEQARQAVAGLDDGQNRYLAPWGPTKNKAAWVYRTHHSNENVSIQRAPGNPFDPEKDKIPRPRPPR